MTVTWEVTNEEDGEIEYTNTDYSIKLTIDSIYDATEEEYEDILDEVVFKGVSIEDKDKDR